MKNVEIPLDCEINGAFIKEFCANHHVLDSECMVLYDEVVKLFNMKKDVFFSIEKIHSCRTYNAIEPPFHLYQTGIIWYVPNIQFGLTFHRSSLTIWNGRPVMVTTLPKLGDTNKKSVNTFGIAIWKSLFQFENFVRGDEGSKPVVLPLQATSQPDVLSSSASLLVGDFSRLVVFGEKLYIFYEMFNKISFDDIFIAYSTVEIIDESAAFVPTGINLVNLSDIYPHSLTQRINWMPYLDSDGVIYLKTSLNSLNRTMPNWRTIPLESFSIKVLRISPTVIPSSLTCKEMNDTGSLTKCQKNIYRVLQHQEYVRDYDIIVSMPSWQWAWRDLLLVTLEYCPAIPIYYYPNQSNDVVLGYLSAVAWDHSSFRLYLFQDPISLHVHGISPLIHIDPTNVDEKKELAWNSLSNSFYHRKTSLFRENGQMLPTGIALADGILWISVAIGLRSGFVFSLEISEVMRTMTFFD